MASKRTAKAEERRRKREQSEASSAPDQEQPKKKRLPDERQMEQRLAQAEALLLRGWTERRVGAELAHAHEVTLRTGLDYVARVKERWAERVAARQNDTRTPEEIDLEHRNRGLMLLDECLKAREFKAAATIYQRLMELDGRGTSRKVELGGGLKHTVDASPEMLAQADEILRRHGYEPPKGGGGDTGE